MGATASFPPELIAKLREARRVLVLTGAGISAESGIPTFRGAGGLWGEFKVEDLATPEAFRKNPKLVWTWYEERRQNCMEAEPNPGHVALARLDEALDDFLLVTQNVDGLHRRAGSRRMIEIHGCILQGRCLDTGEVFDLPDPPLDLPLKTPGRDAPARPHIVWFGETYDPRHLEAAFGYEPDVCLSIGTSAMVGVPATLAARAPYLVEINPEETPLTEYAEACIREPAGKVLPPLVEAWLDRTS